VDRTQLLRRWSELAPEECKISCAEPGYIQAEFHAVRLVRIKSHDARCVVDLYDPAYLLLALIEAIRNRGWHYTLSSNSVELPHRAHVIHGGERAYEYADAAEPCDAMLQAYCAALQAGKERSE
jgi:hypothetical protein